MTSAMRRFRLLAMVSGLAVGAARQSEAGIVVPPGLGPGDQFRIMFVTSGSLFASSSSISTYDSFVTSEAIAAGLTTFNGMAVTWEAIGSTTSVNANDPGRLPTSSTAPIYLVNGTEVASSAAQLWSGSLLAAPDVDENGNAFVASTWTGTLSNGRAAPGRTLGTGSVEFGVSDVFPSDWSAWIDIGVSAPPTTPFYSIYGVSSVLIVPTAAVPEPSTFSGAATAIVTGLIIGLARKRNAQPTTLDCSSVQRTLTPIKRKAA